MDQAKSALKRGNPLRSDIRWQIILLEGVVAVGIGLYALLDEQSARRNIVFLIGVFLLINGLGYAIRQIGNRAVYDPMQPFLLLRAGIGIAAGLIVVVNRFAEFMGLNPSLVVVAIGLLGIGVVTLIGRVMVRDEEGLRVGALATAILLVGWGAVILYQVSDDTSSLTLLGWSAVVVGAGLVVLAYFRRKRSLSVAA